jgi:hypothetical protein
MSATAAIVAATMLGSLALLLRHTEFRWLVGVAAIAIAGIIGVFLLIVGRALVRDQLISQWESKRQAWRELSYARRSNDLLRRLIANLSRNEGQDLASALDEFATHSLELTSMVDGRCGVIVVRETESQYVVEHVRGVVGDRRSQITVGKRCSTGRKFPDVLARLAPHSLIATAETASGESYLVGILVSKPLDAARLEVLSVVEPAFRLVVRVTDGQRESDDVFAGEPRRYLSA